LTWYTLFLNPTQACGKGGDLNKWAKQNIRLLFAVDIADVSIQHANDRFNQSRFSFPAQFHTLDVFAKPLGPLLPDPNYTFDLVSCQFALHYSFESEVKARMALKNAAGRLKAGGFFIGTIPDACRIIKNVEARGAKFGNGVYTVEFEQIERYLEFGHKYTFWYVPILHLIL
jgi:mRNA (guanine-N7-)-methyltransferase